MTMSTSPFAASLHISVGGLNPKIGNPARGDRQIQSLRQDCRWSRPIRAEMIESFAMHLGG